MAVHVAIGHTLQVFQVALHEEKVVGQVDLRIRTRVEGINGSNVSAVIGATIGPNRLLVFFVSDPPL